MIYEDERTTDELVDEILGTGDGVRAGDTEAAADGRTTQRLYLNRCKDCGQTFETPYVGGRYCPACKRKRISEGQKARQAREHAKVAEANDRQDKTGNIREGKEAETVDKDEKTVAEAWEQLGAPETEASKAPEREPESMTKDELRGKLTEGLKKDAGDVVLALYECIRDVARTAGIQTRTILESMWELDSILSHIGGV